MTGYGGGGGGSVEPGGSSVSGGGSVAAGGGSAGTVAVSGGGSGAAARSETGGAVSVSVSVVSVSVVSGLDLRRVAAELVLAVPRPPDDLLLRQRRSPAPVHSPRTRDTNRFQIVAGKLPPETEMPWTFVISIVAVG